MLQAPKDLPQLIRSFEAHALAHPEDLSLMFKLGRLYLRNRNHPEACRAYRQILQHDADNLQARVELALCEAQQRHFDEAQCLLEDALAREPASLAVLLACSRVHEWQGHVEQQISFLLRAANAAPRRHDIHLQLAELLRRYGDFSGAIAEYRRALELQADLESARFALGVLLMKRGELNEATDHFQQIVSRNPSAHDAYFNLGQCHAQRRQWQQAAIALQAAARGLKDHFGLQMLLVQAWTNLGDLDRAMVILEQLAEKLPENEVVLLALADLYERCGEVDSAAETYSLLTRRYPEKPDYTVKWVQSLLRLNRHAEVPYILQGLFQRHPGHIEGHRLLGEAFIGQKQYKSARDEFAKTLMVNESYLPGLVGLIQVARLTDDAAEEYRLMQRLIEHNPDDLDTLLRLGRLERDLGLPANLERFRRITNLAPDSVQAREAEYYLRHAQKERPRPAARATTR
ncbi:MAG TPA: tetratricopeptide repeat protein [Candidatus Ozemobacteraceae bacterium]|nr:tetratricopeptide repeat protein [Candidatus Ozemobacteraceae bacterium]